MAVNVYGLTFTDVRSQELSWLQDVNTSTLTAAIQRAAAELNTELRAMEITPSDITASNYPDDYEWCRSTVMYGAAGYFLRNMTGAEEAATVKMRTFGERIKMFRDRPQMLEAYNALASSTLTARGPGNYGDTQAAASARLRFLNPADPARWRQ